jgi:general secretion pathway protein E
MSLAAPAADLQTALGQHLLAAGGLDETGLRRAQRAAELGQGPFHLLLTRLGLVDETSLARALARVAGLPFVERGDYPEAAPEIGSVSVRFLRENRVVPLGEEEDGVAVALADPLDGYTITALEAAIGRRVLPRVGVPAEIEAALDRLYGRGGEHPGTGGEFGLPGEIGEEDIERLKDLASEAPVIRLVNTLIGRAVEQRASDIHIEAFRGRLSVRYRIDGDLQEMEPPPERLRAAIVSRVKIMARLDIAERRLPQDGRIKLPVRGRDIDLRVSILPTMHGESVVLRILDRSGLKLDLEALGFDAVTAKPFRAALARPNGIVLVTGPTGSGKTSTLYAAMLELRDPRRKIVTVEDPIEYELDGINQIQTKPTIGLSFANALRSILRHDPDIIMIGEIRDGETAQIAVQSALTGHLVLSTVHTNSAAATVARLLDMGVEDYLLTSTLNAVLAQRLVRRLCPHCREPYRPLPELLDHLGAGSLVDDPSTTLHRPRGCAECQGRGYQGRVAVIEVLALSDTIRRLVLGHAEAGELQRAAVAEGMRVMYQDGLRKALAGATTLEEVLRVTRES